MYHTPFPSLYVLSQDEPRDQVGELDPIGHRLAADVEGKQMLVLPAMAAWMMRCGF